jgi:transcriptional regulator with XRE-family HTH domain
MSLGSRLKIEREKKNWSQMFVAEKIGITNSVLSNYERDYRDPDTSTLAKIAELYEVTTDYLLGRPDNLKGTSSIDKLNEYNEKDEKDIAKRMEEIRKDLTNQDGLSFDGEPMSEEAIESLMDAMEHIVRQTQRINKKYIPKKYRKDNNHE